MFAIASRRDRIRFVFLVLSVATSTECLHAAPLANTVELTWDGDLAAKLVDQADAFLLRELEASVTRRRDRWQRDTSNAAAYTKSIAANRLRFAHQLGARDTRPAVPRVELIVPANIGGNQNRASDSTIETRVGSGDGFDIFAIRLRAFDEVDCVALLLQPVGRTPVADVIAVPHCDTLPEQLVGLTTGVDPRSQFARRLAESGCRVVVPLLINRQRAQFDWGARPAPQITNREMLYRSAFEVGRGLIAYEVEALQAIVDFFRATAPEDRAVGIYGWGEGGLLALYAGAIDTRLQVVGVSGYFASRQQIWQEPIDRNVCGLLSEFGDAELASLIVPRRLIIEAAAGPVATYSGEGGGAPANLIDPDLSSVSAEATRASRLVHLDEFVLPKVYVGESRTQGLYGCDESLGEFLKQLNPVAALLTTPSAKPQLLRDGFTFASSVRDQMRQFDRHTQQVLQRSPNTRREYWQQLDTSSPEAFQRTSEIYRQRFYDEVIGRYDYPLLSPQPRSRQVYETDNWKAYEVVLDVFDSIYAYGLLLVPKSMQEGEQRPVVVCQHGLEGRPQDTVGRQSSHYYAGFAGALADRGFITFAPQNLYIGGDRFRTLQRKSYPLGKTLFSIIVPQHQQIVNWLKTLPMVDSKRIAFYGLSYGGKTAMRVPPLVTDYCLSICSADFNEWVDKNASTTNPRSYVWSGEYEIFEFDLGSRFNYAEMAALIAPRPFMVERGHFDGVADDWTVAAEFAKVRELYAAKLRLPADDCQIEWFVGPHQIHGVGTYTFLHHHLNWPAPQANALPSK